MTTHTCAWCPATFPTVTGHLVHASTAHPEALGRGRTRTRTWSCWRCASENPAASATCGCGWTHPYHPATTTPLENP